MFSIRGTFFGFGIRSLGGLDVSWAGFWPSRNGNLTFTEFTMFAFEKV